MNDETSEKIGEWLAAAVVAIVIAFSISASIDGCNASKKIDAQPARSPAGKVNDHDALQDEATFLSQTSNSVCNPHHAVAFQSKNEPIRFKRKTR